MSLFVFRSYKALHIPQNGLQEHIHTLLLAVVRPVLKSGIQCWPFFMVVFECTELEMLASFDCVGLVVVRGLLFPDLVQVKTCFGLLTPLALLTTSTHVGGGWDMGV